MHPWTITIVGAVALSLAGAFPRHCTTEGLFSRAT
jgi:hypothetical protein